MGVGNHIKEHRMLGFYGFGRDAITVGSGGYLASLDDLADYLGNQTYFTALSHSVTEVSITQNDPYLEVTSGTYTGISEGDWWSPDGNIWYEIEELLGTTTLTLIKLKNNYTGTTLTNDTNAVYFASSSKQNIILLPNITATADVDLSALNGVVADIQGIQNAPLNFGFKWPKSGLMRFKDIDFGRNAEHTAQASTANGNVRLSFENCKSMTETGDIFKPNGYIGTLDVIGGYYQFENHVFATELTGGKAMNIFGGEYYGCNPTTIEHGGNGRAGFISHCDTNIYGAKVRVGLWIADGRSANGISGGGMFVDGIKAVTVHAENCNILIGGAGDSPPRYAAIYGSSGAYTANAICELNNCTINHEVNPTYPTKELIDNQTWTMNTGSLDIYHSRLNGAVKSPASFTAYTASNNIA